MKTTLSAHKQRGAATLLTALVLLICITLIGLLTAKTVLVETQITSDNYRINQATAAASAAMDRGVAYFVDNGFDHDGNGSVDYIGPATSCGDPTTTINTTPFNFTLTVGNQTTYAQFYYDNTNDVADTTDDICPAATPNMKRGIVIAKGWSDDCTAVRTITQCVGTVDVFRVGAGPQQAFVSKGSVGAGGGGTIINRYTNINVWSGGDYGGTSAAYDTYIRPTDKDIADYTTDELDSPDKTLNTKKVSDNNSGIGLDIITNDATLASQTSSTDAEDMNNTAKNQFFDMYFSETKQGIKNMAEKAGQLITNGTVPATASGLVWVEGDMTNPPLSGNLGSSTAPITLIVNGDLKIAANTVFYGVIYVTGDITTVGGSIVYGSMIGEITNANNSISANSTLVYKPWSGGSDDQSPFQKGTGAVIAGSWKDW